jgi:DNA-binding NarL/FixJ family response regulator
MQQPINVLLVDDHEVVRAGFNILLSAQPHIGNINEVNRGEAVVQAYIQHKPDVVVMDLSMPGIGGMEAIRRLIKHQEDAKILVYSIHEEAIYVERALQAGASGYVSKNSAAETLAEAVKTVSLGHRYVEPALEDALPQAEHNSNQSRNLTDLLSPREFEVFLRLAKGMTAHAIADEMHLGYKTVANYSTQVKSKLNVSSVAELTNIAMVSGVIKAEL